MHILIAPNAFKNSISADAAAEAIRKGLEESALVADYTLLPVGDGGDGTGALLTLQCKGEIIAAPALDPLGRNISALYGMIDGGSTAVIEMAAASGLRLLKTEELDPMRATSFGTGMQIRQALDNGATEIIIAVGGSATVDGGCGLLQALGFRFLDAGGNILDKLPTDLHRLAVIDDSLADKRIKPGAITVLCDVRNPLLGEKGAARVFGPQKGATPAQVQQLETGLLQFAHVIHQQKNFQLDKLEHGGAAGGVAAGLYALLGATLVNGIDYFMQHTGFDEALTAADLVITGEGSLDKQTLEGKAPFGVAVRSRERGVPVIAMAGKIEAGDEQLLSGHFDQLICINQKPADLASALSSAKANLIEAAYNLGNGLAKKSRLQS